MKAEAKLLPDGASNGGPVRQTKPSRGDSDRDGDAGADEPFFIVGSARTGTTLLQSFLAAHSALAIPPETHFFHSTYPWLRRFVRVGRLHDLKGAVRAIKANPYMTPFQEFADQLSRELEEGVGFDRFIDTLFRRYAQSVGKDRWGEKTPHHLWYWRRIDRVFPDSRFIITARDGRDVVCSMMNVPWASDSIYANGFRWKKEVEIAREMREELGEERAIVVSYEDLVSETEPTLNRLCEFLGVPYEPQMLRRNGQTRQLLHDKEIPWKKNVHLAPFTGSIGRHTRELDRMQLRDLNALLGTELHELRYRDEKPNGGAPRRGWVGLRGRVEFYLYLIGRMFGRM